MKKRYQLVSQQFKEQCKENVSNLKYATIHVIEDNIDITESDNLVDFEIEDNCYVNDKFVGTTVAKKIIVNILNPNNEINLENKEIQVCTGMMINGVKENVPFGNFIIEKPENEEVEEKTFFIGYDYMIKFNPTYKNRVTYPIPAGELFEDLCNQVGLEAGSTDFVNSNYMILGNPFTDNEDCRTVLSNIAQLAGGFAKIGRDNKVYIKTLKNASNLLTVKYVDTMTVKELNLTQIRVLLNERENSDEYINGNNYFTDFSKNEQWGELNSLVLAVSNIEGENTALDDKDSIAHNGLTEIVIQDNYFLIDQEEREKAIVPIWNTLKGMKYLPFKTQYYGYPYLDSGDMIYIEDSKDIGYVSYVFNHSFKYNGSYNGNLDTPAMTKTQVAYKNTFDVKSKFKRVESKVDKINGEITDIIEEQTETAQKLTQHEQTIEGISDTVSSIETNLENNYPTTTEMTSAITQKANEINLEVATKVGKSEVVSSINQSAEVIKILANKIALEGYTTINEGFSVDTNGNMTAQNALFKGGQIKLTDEGKSDPNPTFLIKQGSNGQELSLTSWGMNNSYITLGGSYESGCVLQVGKNNNFLHYEIVDDDYLLFTIRNNGRNFLYNKQDGLCIPTFYADTLNGGKPYAETVLYDDSTGTTGNVYLSQSATNFDYIEIFFHNNDGYYNSAKVWRPNKVALTVNYTNESYLWIKTSLISIAGSTITRVSSSECRIGENGISFNTSSNIYITRVVGYK